MALQKSEYCHSIGKKSFETDLHLLIPPKIWHLGKPDNAL